MLRSIIIAFSTYSKIPMPHIEWNKRSMRYSIGFFPMVGVAVGVCELLLVYILSALHTKAALAGALLAVLPFIVTGGIHMDGYMDTIDARASYKDREQKLNILKDAHVGAFSVIYAIIYMLADYGLMQELYGICVQMNGYRAFVLLAVGYVLSRGFSGISVVVFAKAKGEGMLADTAEATDRRVLFILALWLLFGAGGLLLLDFAAGMAVIAVCIVSFVYYGIMAYREFGGITGDIAGYFLQLCEFFVLFAIVLVWRIRLM